MEASCPARADSSRTGTAAVRGSALQRRDQLQAVHSGHHDVADDKVGNLGPNGLERLLGRRRPTDLITGVFEQIGQVLAHVGVVVGDQHPCALAVALGGRDTSGGGSDRRFASGVGRQPS